MINRKIPGVHMLGKDLGELYTYLELFNKVYGGYEEEVETIRNGILEIYTKGYWPKDADTALRELRNPRGAGRKSTITDEKTAEIVQFRKMGMSMREISAETGVSKSSVQRILEAERRKSSRF